MCGRYTVDTDNYEIRQIARGLGEDICSFSEGEVFPSQNALTVASYGGKPVPKVMRWGFSIANGARLIINGKGETLSQKSMFADSFANRRCIVVSTGFFEWDAGKQKYLFNTKENGVLYLGGIWKRSEAGDCFVIITLPANESMIATHERMPFIVSQENVRPWLSDASIAEDLIMRPQPELIRTAV